MIDPKFFDELVRRCAAVVPPGLQQIQNELQENLRSVLQSMFSRLDLVSREEFDIQAGVLAKTRRQLEQLEKQLQQLEGNQRISAECEK